jgi:type I restriction enzyme S subunit
MESEPRLPKGWAETSLGQVANVVFSNVDKKSWPSEQPVRLCNYLDVYQNDYLGDDHEYMVATASLPEIRKFSLQAGDVLITKDSETPDDIGIPAVVDSVVGTLVCGYHLALIRPGATVNPVFLAKQIGHERIQRYFGKEANGITRYGLSTASVTGLPLWLPPRPEQDGVAVVLRTLDEAISRTEQVIAKLQQMKQGLLHDLLTRGVDENADLRHPPGEAPHLYKDSPLGRIPKEWSAKMLGDVATIGSGTTPSRSMSAFWTGGTVPWVKTGEVNFNEINDSDEHVTELAVRMLGMRRWPIGTVLVAMYGQGATRGRVAYLSVPATTNQACAALAAHPDAAVPRFLFHLLRWNYDRIRGAAQGSNQSNLSAALLGAVRFPMPPVEEQARSVEALDSLDANIQKEAVLLEQMRQLKRGMAHDLLQGRVRVVQLLSGGNHEFQAI